MTNCFSVHSVLFWYWFPRLLRNSGNKHQNKPLVCAETVRYSSTYIILYIFCNGKLQITNISKRLSPGIELNVTVSRVALRDNPPHRYRTGWCLMLCRISTSQSTRIQGIWDIGDWSHRYGYVYFLGWGGGITCETVCFFLKTILLKDIFVVNATIFCF